MTSGLRLVRNSLVMAAAVLLTVANGSARADFIVDSNPDGDKFFNGDANKGVTTFTGTVGGQHSGPEVTVDTDGAVDTGAGFSNIKPAKNESLKTLTFTPADPKLFDGFSFRGQLNDDANETVTLTVLANSGFTKIFTFKDLGENKDFDRIGIIASPGSGDTIKSITLTSDWKEQKQNEFHYGKPVVPEPSTITLFGLGIAGFGGYTYRRRRASSKA